MIFAVGPFFSPTLLSILAMKIESYSDLPFFLNYILLFCLACAINKPNITKLLQDDKTDRNSVNNSVSNNN